MNIAAIFAANSICAYPLDMARRANETAAFYSDEYGLFIDALVAARHRAEVSQRELANRLNLDPSIVAKIETRVRRIDVVELLRMLEALDVDPTEFIGALADSLGDRR